ncbi:hypothetical protein [Legionella brunensis]|uniref:Uncharacterized protein n=1 Tax=Legionella brunensis TaxID=29422 RepID=A0A0W0SNF5_9GAMM|nr:hypothetical protein [Legionella brunensis]KTC84930.1 hypothetical protein Lbru_1145 [Legionella brunensis]
MGENNFNTNSTKSSLSRELITEIRTAESPIKLRGVFKTIDENFLKKAKFASGFVSSVGRCQLALKISSPQPAARLECSSPD